MSEIPEDPSGPQLDPDLPEQGIDTGTTERPDEELTLDDPEAVEPDPTHPDALDPAGAGSDGE